MYSRLDLGLSRGLVCYLFFCFFFKQKTAYEMRISDWSSDVCSSDLPRAPTSKGSTRHTWSSLEPPTSNIGWISLSGNRVQITEIGRASCRERVCQYV